MPGPMKAALSAKPMATPELEMRDTSQRGATTIPFLINMLGQGQLDQDAVDGRVGIEIGRAHV